jgi:selenocysteine-specific elongation factor
MRIVGMRNIIVGTAGHIDHGKTALVRALTGIDTDRLEEEKRRGISIDLGFAHLDLDATTRLGFVDVPGHERFIKNMLAGVGGIDLALFIIAADESIKPQTREHFDICRLLKIPKGIIVLTKRDLVDSDILELVRLEVEEFVRGSFLENAPVVAVSSTTGEGLAELKRELAKIAAEIAPKDATRWFRMPVDRAFSMKGFGAVITGTLASGSVAVDQEIEIYPIGRRVRARGVQVHGAPVQCAYAGQRTALNLAGIEVQELARGMTASEPGRFAAARVVDAVFELLPGARPLKHGAPVHFHTGAAEIEAEVRLLDGAVMKPGTRAYVRFILRCPALILPGDRFIVRMFSPVTTIGGGEALDISAPVRIKRADAITRLRELDSGDALRRISLLVRESAYGMSESQLISRTGLMPAEIDAAAKTGDFLVLREPQLWLVDRRWAAEKAKAIQAAVRDFHQQHPLAPGMSREELRSRELPGAPSFVADAVIATIKTLTSQGDVIRLASHRVAFKEDESAALRKIEAAFESAGLEVPATADVLARSGVEPARARALLQILLKQGALIRVGDDLVFHRSAVSALKNHLQQHKGQRFSVPQFKEWTGVSRKYAIPLLEFLDREKVTRREGDQRIVLG